MSFRERVGAGAQVAEGIRAARIGGRRGVHRGAEIVGAGECHGHGVHAGFTRAELPAVVVQIAIDRTGERGWREFAEVIAAGGGIAAEDDAGDDVAERVVDGRAAGSARGVFAVEKAARLHLGERVTRGVARADAEEAVVAARVRGRGQIHRRAEIVHSGESDGHTTDPRLTRTCDDPVVIQVAINRAREVGSRRENGQRVVFHLTMSREVRADGALVNGGAPIVRGNGVSQAEAEVTLSARNPR